MFWPNDWNSRGEMEVSYIVRIDTQLVGLSQYLNSFNSVFSFTYLVQMKPAGWLSGPIVFPPCLSAVRKGLFWQMVLDTPACESRLCLPPPFYPMTVIPWPCVGPEDMSPMVLSALGRMDPGSSIRRFQLRDIWAHGVIFRGWNIAPGGSSP